MLRTNNKQHRHKPQVVLSSFYASYITGNMYSNHKTKKKKLKVCRFFVVPGGGSMLLGMPDIEVLGISHVR